MVRQCLEGNRERQVTWLSAGTFTYPQRSDCLQEALRGWETAPLGRRRRPPTPAPEKAAGGLHPTQAWGGGGRGEEYGPRSRAKVLCNAGPRGSEDGSEGVSAEQCFSEWDHTSSVNTTLDFVRDANSLVASETCRVELHGEPTTHVFQSLPG